LALYDIFARSTGPDGPRWLDDGQGILASSTGSYTLSNMVMRILFTTKGSIPTARSEGTYLPNLVGNVTDVEHAKATAISAIADAESYIKKMQLRSPVSRDETLSRLVINNILVRQGPGLVVRILVYSASDAVIPLEVTV
jgi:hypothetical protein